MTDTLKGDRPIDRALRMAEDRGWSRTRFARELHQSPQTITNWDRRGMPPEWHAPVAALFKVSVEELIGRTPPKSPSPPPPRWPFDTIPFADYDSLEESQKLELVEIIEDRIRRFSSRLQRATPKRRKTAR